MTIKRKPKPQWLRRAAAAAAAGAVVYVVAATAASTDLASAWEMLGEKNQWALGILKSQLEGVWTTGGLPVGAAMAIGQSPVLLSSQEAVLELRQTEEEDDSPTGGEDTEGGREERPTPGLPAEPSAPVAEEPAQPETPLVFADNGVQARTLTPSSPEGYIVTGDVYINNRSDKSFDETLFDGSFAAKLSEEEGPKVLILHTHGSEAYTMPPGQEYEPSGESRTTDCAYNVVRVGDELARTLEEAGIGVVHDPALYDYPEYSGAYGRSLTAAERAMEEYPSISLVLDIHRDAISDGDGSPYKVISNVAGVNAAQMSFIIGSDGGGLEHEGWRENLKLAAALQQHLTEDYPTLMRPISVRNSRYNQHVSPGALLIEMGAAGNSLDEALLSARLLGQAIGEMFLNKE
ncbi:MAG: stage II sporulation protein P [Oscillospiraceae bacterium]|nr:stage II sporulation protein P [Oscillospiraceae bacterium]